MHSKIWSFCQLPQVTSEHIMSIVLLQPNIFCVLSHIIDRSPTIVGRHTLLRTRPMHLLQWLLLLLLLIWRHRVTRRWRAMMRIWPTTRHHACTHVARGRHAHLLHHWGNSWRSLVVRTRTWRTMMARRCRYISRGSVAHVHLLLPRHRLSNKLARARLGFRASVIVPHLLSHPSIRLTWNSSILASRIPRCTWWGVLEAIRGAHTRCLSQDRGLCWWQPWVGVITTSVIVDLQMNELSESAKHAGAMLDSKRYLLSYFHYKLFSILCKASQRKSIHTFSSNLARNQEQAPKSTQLSEDLPRAW
jgi:hypothetical protein